MTEMKNFEGPGTCPMQGGRPGPATGCRAPGRQLDGPERAGAAYSRIFPHLPALPGPEPDALKALGRAGGPCDGGTATREASGAAGWPFFGQFIAHDITADRSPLERKDHTGVENHRAPRLDLECLYGGGPGGSPYLFDAEDPAKFLLAETGQDVPRTRQGVAIIGDPRNDSHLFMSALHLSMLKAHNALVDRYRAQGTAECDLFEAARRSLTWHYQWIVAEVFLPELAGADLVADLRSGKTRLPLPASGSLPYEFADAAYRYGHSQIRQSYRLQPGGPEWSLFPDLLGFRPVAPEKVVDWRMLFDGNAGVTAQRANRISERLPKTLVSLPEAVTGAVTDDGFRSLANRDLQRGTLTDLPSGEAIARELGVEVLDRRAIGLPDWSGETPLWYYLAREADTLEQGDRLGPVGGRIVAGVLLSLLDRDPGSYIRAAPGWQPEIAPLHGPSDTFTLLDLLLSGDAAR